MTISREQKAIEIIMKTRPGRRKTFKRLLKDERGVAAIVLTVYLPFLLGLLLVVPLLGHASWHAYRDLVSAGGLVERP